jgi:hypothetical protein
VHDTRAGGHPRRDDRPQRWWWWSGVVFLAGCLLQRPPSGCDVLPRGAFVELVRRLADELLPDVVRLMGADHPATLAIRSNLAAWTGYAGEPAKARDLFDELLPDTARRPAGPASPRRPAG